ncbi:MAG: endolytic transglycosylase MltG [Candidatus Eremiobacter antarcticus]|nr:endolytic transglycosylase MltG [Candidatus Eremiobacteraeota bacterium]MBC5809207.1 endolytic transglycosylase MltG [Candidatus Eremiobacteraeota bacterium]
MRPGSSISQIGAQLKAEGVVSSARLFSLYVQARHLAPQIQAAEYTFPAHLSLREVTDVLRQGGRAPAVWLTIPEGFTAREIAQRVAGAGLSDARTFLQMTRSVDLRIDGAVTRGLEGYLFPDTYLVPRHDDARAIAGLMTAQFLAELPRDHAALAKRLGFTVPQIVTIASMVEREAKVDDERAMMAGVYYNRLRIGMPLEVDATIEYAFPRHKKLLTFADLKLETPYNTYLHGGLPPTPIANPGRKSLLAAFHPATVDYLYYVYRGGGRHQFSRTLEEQEAAERKYLH